MNQFQIRQKQFNWRIRLSRLFLETWNELSSLITFRRVKHHWSILCEVWRTKCKENLIWQRKKNLFYHDIEHAHISVIAVVKIEELKMFRRSKKTSTMLSIRIMTLTNHTIKMVSLHLITVKKNVFVLMENILKNKMKNSPKINVFLYQARNVSPRSLNIQNANLWWYVNRIYFIIIWW